MSYGDSEILNIVGNDNYFVTGINKYSSTTYYFSISTDGVTFTNTTMACNYKQDLWVDNDIFYFSSNGSVFKSIDGQNWSTIIDNVYNQDACYMCRLANRYLTYSWNSNNTNYQKVGFSSDMQYTPTYAVRTIYALSSASIIYSQDASRMAISNKNVIFLFANYKSGLKFQLAYIMPNYINAYMKVS